MTRAPALIPLLLLAACAFLDEQDIARQRADSAAFAQTQLVGLSKAEILACAGTPARTAKAGDSESLIYVSGGSAASPEKSCEVTFVLRRGYVEKVDYSVTYVGLMARGDQCAFVVQKCVGAR
jgi:hypothetical protein